uniref:DUF3040 domain-containing protein n=1 Tax=Pseudonocardia pini TaxID=2758030 RepID=UPI0015F0BCC0
MSVPESRPPHLTDAERQQLEELEQRLLGQFPDLGGRFASRQVGNPTPHEVRVARILFALVGVLVVVVGGVVGGLGGAAAVLVAVGG